jgi:hypothetical protein
MHWNNRVVEHKNERGDVYYQVHEVYYNDDGSISKELGMTKEAITPTGETVDDLIETLETMLYDAKRSRSDVLCYKTVNDSLDDLGE